MQKTNMRSVFEIWDLHYINNDDNRRAPEDKDAYIIQIEHAYRG